MKLVGFDARTTLASGWEAWSADRRDKYLLRREVAKPLSVDAMIWPPVFSRSQAPKWTGALGLWENLRSLEEELLAQDAALTHPYRVVAVTLLWELLTSGERARWNEPPKFTATEPGELDSAWRFLGYDVADMFLTSGLSNCAWSPDEMHRARNTWGASLNEHNLFGKAADAQLFKVESDSRVAEHAPFSVFGVYLVRELGNERKSEQR